MPWSMGSRIPEFHFGIASSMQNTWSNVRRNACPPASANVEFVGSPISFLPNTWF